MNLLASAYMEDGRVDLALPLLEETLRLRKSRLGPDDPETLNSMNNLAEAYRSGGRLDLAIPLHAETLGRRRRSSAATTSNVTSINNLALGYKDAEMPDRALPLFEESLEAMAGQLGPTHPDTLTVKNNLAISTSRPAIPSGLRRSWRRR